MHGHKNIKLHKNPFISVSYNVDRTTLLSIWRSTIPDFP